MSIFFQRFEDLFLKDLTTTAILIFIGLIAGLIAAKLTGNTSSGTFGNILIGVCGAFLGTFLFSFAGLGTVTIVHKIIAAVVGSILVLSILKLMMDR